MLISERMLFLLAKAIAQKSKSFIRYGELKQYLPDHDNFRQVLVEIILREQKHFESLSEVISQLLAGENHSAALELMTGNVDDNKQDEVKARAGEKVGDKADEIKREEVFNDIGDAEKIKTILLNKLVKAKRSLKNRDDLESAMPLEEEEKNVSSERVTSVTLSEEKKPAEAEPAAEKQTWEKVQKIKENNVPEENQLPIEALTSEEIQAYSPKEINNSFQQEEKPTEQCTVEQCPDVSSNKSGLLVWTFGKQ